MTRSSVHRYEKSEGGENDEFTLSKMKYGTASTSKLSEISGNDSASIYHPAHPIESAPVPHSTVQQK